MSSNKYLKYFIRFSILQILLSYVSVFYLNRYLISSAYCELCIGNSFAMQIDANLWEDRNRFFPFISENYVNIEYFTITFVFIFLIILYSTKFYTYVNELDFSYDRKFVDDYFMLYLLWNSFVFSSLYVFRITGLSRANLVLFSFLIPMLLLLFRNSEILSILLGRSVSNENYISFNLDEFSNFKNLRILAFRNEKLSIKGDEMVLPKKIIKVPKTT